MNPVILDTNGLILPFQFGINLDDELQRLFGDVEVYVPTSVVQELKGLERKDALELSKKYEVVDVEKGGDEGVLEAARDLDGMILTNDKELKKRAATEGIPIVFLRSESHLEVIGEKF